MKEPSENEDPSDEQNEYHGTTTCRSTPTTALPCLSSWERLWLRLRAWPSEITAHEAVFLLLVPAIGISIIVVTIALSSLVDFILAIGQPVF